MMTKQTEFNNLMRPLMQYLADNHHPHVTLIVTASTAELVEGILATVCDSQKPTTAKIYQLNNKDA